MKNSIKILFLGIIALAMVFSNAKKIEAKNCYSVYGGGEVCDKGKVTIDKKIKNPAKNEWWDNIDSSDYTFAPGDSTKSGETVEFKLTVKNISDVKVNETTIRDILPEKYITYVSSSTGGTLYDTRRVDFVEGDLDSGETKDYFVTIKIKNSNEVPTGITCLTNKGEAYATTDDSSDTNTAMFCIKNGAGEKKVLGVSYPETGPNDIVVLGLEMIGFGGLGGAYVWMARKNKKLI